MHHVRKPDVHGPLERSVHFGRDVVSRQRPADDLQVLHRLDARYSGGRVYVASREHDIKASAADQLSVRDRTGRIPLYRDHAVADSELVHGHAELPRRHLQQDPAGLCGDAAHGPAVTLDRVRPARAALIDGHVGPAHDERALLEGDVQLVAHHLTERGSGALAPVGLSDVEGRRGVLMNDQPRIEQAEVGLGIGSGGPILRCFAGVGPWGLEQPCAAEAQNEEARALEKVPS